MTGLEVRQVRRVSGSVRYVVVREARSLMIRRTWRTSRTLTVQRFERFGLCGFQMGAMTNRPLSLLLFFPQRNFASNRRTVEPSNRTYLYIFECLKEKNEKRVVREGRVSEVKRFGFSMTDDIISTSLFSILISLRSFRSSDRQSCRILRH